jgi:hypothetical protein
METNAGFLNRLGILDNIFQRPDQRWVEREKADSVTNTGDGLTRDSVILETVFLRDD